MVPNPASLPFSAALPGETETLQVPVGAAFNFLQYATDAAQTLGVPVSTLTTLTVSVVVDGIPMTFDPADGAVTESVEASASSSVATGLPVSVSAYLQSGQRSEVAVLLFDAPASDGPNQCFPGPALPELYGHGPGQRGQLDLVDRRPARLGYRRGQLVILH